jgi:hypothetical protein
MQVSYYRKKLSDKDYYLSQARRPLPANKFSRFRGVTKGTPTHPYRVVLTYKGQRHYIGNFVSELDAARAYNEAALRIIGDFALLNELGAE